MADDDHISDDDLAAEYVLGVLEGAARADVAARVERDATFAALVRAWEERLASFNDGYEEVTPPPHLKAAIDARLFAPAPRRSVWGWLAGGLTAVVAVLAVVVLTLQTPQEAFVAELRADESDFVVTVEATDSSFEVALLEGTVPEDRVLELWQIVGDAAPVSLGLLGAQSQTPGTPFGEGQIIAVSLEPQGGSPTGAPTGPVVALGVLQKI